MWSIQYGIERGLFVSWWFQNWCTLLSCFVTYLCFVFVLIFDRSGPCLDCRFEFRHFGLFYKAVLLFSLVQLESEELHSTVCFSFFTFPFLFFRKWPFNSLAAVIFRHDQHCAWLLFRPKRTINEVIAVEGHCQFRHHQHVKAQYFRLQWIRVSTRIGYFWPLDRQKGQLVEPT